MTQTPDAGTAPARKRAGGLSGMLIADLRTMAAGLGVGGAQTMKKAQLVEAIKSAQTGAAPQAAPPAAPPVADSPRTGAGEPPASEDGSAGAEEARAERPARTRRREEPAQGAPETEPQGDQAAQRRDAQPEQDQRPDRTSRNDQGQKPDQAQKSDQGQKPDQGQKNEQNQKPDQDASSRQGGDDGTDEGEGRGRNRRRRGRERRTQQGGAEGGQPDQGGNQGGQNQGNQNNQQGQGNQNQGNQGNQGKGQQGGKGGQQRDQGQQGGGNRHEPDTTVLDDDVLVPAAGIVDVLDNYAFVRTSGYLPGADDVYLSLSLVRRFGLRRGDAVVGQVRQPREGERKEKFNPMVRIDSVNGAEPDRTERTPFEDLVAVDPAERLRLETGRDDVLGRMLDLVAPLGKGQRGLVLAPADSGATTVLRAVASSLSTNHPECHLMAVLVDCRPEEATALSRSFKGEVVASTLDRTAAEHVSVAELALERAKRLVELGHDAVLLLDGVTTLGRAHGQTTTGHPRSAPAGSDPVALQAPRRYVGAARNVENGGSLTILATVRTESAAPLDAAVLEELTGAANLVVRLRGDLARDRDFPALDLVASRTRNEDGLVGREELAAVEVLRRELGARTPAEAVHDLRGRLNGSQSNIELLTRLHQRPASSARG